MCVCEGVYARVCACVYDRRGGVVCKFEGRWEIEYLCVRGDLHACEKGVASVRKYDEIGRRVLNEQ